MTKEQAILKAKEFRVALDNLLQQMKEHRHDLIACNPMACSFHDNGRFDDPQEVIAQHTISIRDLESAIMRQGMTLKAIGNPTPYPESFNPKSTLVHPPADGLKL